MSEARHPHLDRELATIEAMIRIYCADHHATAQPPCDACRALRDYAEKRLHRCPFGEAKPVCNKCTVHCYIPAMREQVKAVMRYAGPRMMVRHPWLAFRHLLDQRRPALTAKELRAKRAATANDEKG